MFPVIAALYANAGSPPWHRREPLPHGIIAALDRLARHLSPGLERDAAGADELLLPEREETKHNS
jgi:hypothetical protein